MVSIIGSVGSGGKNIPLDVALVTCALQDLGYVWADEGMDELVSAIRLFQSACAGLTRVAGDGRVDVGGTTARNLDASGAPRWVRLPRGPGLAPYELDDLLDDHDWCGHHVDHGLLAAGRALPAGVTSIGVNDGSKPRGGPTQAHKGHQTGADVDVRLPRRDGRHGGVTWRDSLYDRASMRAQLQVLRGERLKVVYFNDPVLVAEGLCKPFDGHDNHVHLTFDLRP